jgi:hypothetical protein
MLRVAIIRAAVMVGFVVATLLVSPTIKDSQAGIENSAPSNSKTKLALADIETQIVASEDRRGEKLAAFLSRQGSPMTSDAKNLVEIADRYDLDWRLLPAIAGLESTYGRVVPLGSYNPYGWNNGRHRFADWVAASDFVGYQLKHRYGGDDPWRIGPAYAASPTWATRVNRNMHLISQF